ncbi:hypothetical protein H4S08_003999 [Coemansia sp. RSA 1365]|nr:hypothetical protein H4S08_003999 [Coemansia sp. RSA 1365]
MATPLPTFDPAERLMFENFPLPLPVVDTHTETQWITIEGIAHNLGTVYKQAPAPTTGCCYMTIIILFVLVLGLVFALVKMYFVVKELQVQINTLAIKTNADKQLLISAVLELENKIKDSSENQDMVINNIAANSDDIKNVKMFVEDMYSKVKIECLDAIGKQVESRPATKDIDTLAKEISTVTENLAMLLKDSYEE